ncbi:Rieske (2Fe-2S) protein [Meiothermus taiwanensis]|jgi:3-phenylpropionate/trans-cinnamate dioxygenase ferredoxin subunit|uniref:Toluene 1,2-dioxygenase system ferredoxin subunit n=2 Tax=Meiothermus taiwanensis TaxID=172827 RepID=A0A399DTY1_9DEIN|nr:non-heme iron oxygenase ferredoxin subunit [Meiothermus taiwanensis]AWR85749.1 3-phenylpropionate/trans-cinnamate dioxygenase ferredoxin component [Meiothermus taiwanensis WR-220]KIQ53624.1 diguanylate cyclase [Meiothermus taiwanensis]KZK14956.1 diguanylate cyclase [Meiothermus taiwanensis]RIH75507.1 Toluene 1,2-dioxygenase system ferredoxin subunit [Meiothermus taiwanensis]
MWIPVARLEEFQNGRLVVRVEGEKTPVLLIHAGEEIFAISDICTHDKNPLSDGPIEGENIRCTRHGAKFNLRTGKATLPAPRPVKAYKARLEDGQVWLEV